MTFYTTWLIVFIMTVVRAKHCPTDEAQRKLMEGLLVKDNPTDLFVGFQFFDVWVKKYLKEHYVCSYDVYTKTTGGSIEVASYSGQVRGRIGQDELEFLRETDKNGLYSIKTLYDTGLVIDGYKYMLYADKHAIAYYECEVYDSNWHLKVQLKSDGQAKLAAKDGDAEVKESIEKAHQKLAEAAKILDLDIEKELVIYDVDKLC